MNKTSAPITLPPRLLKEGAALAVCYTKEMATADKSFRASILETGFDNRLGELMHSLTDAAQAAGYKRIPSSLIKLAGVDGIPDQRRSEALWLHDNAENVAAFIADSGKATPWISLTSVKAAMTKAAKAAKAAEKAASAGEGDKGDEGKGESESAGKADGISASYLAAYVMKTATSNDMARAAAEAIIIALDMAASFRAAKESEAQAA